MSLVAFFAIGLSALLHAVWNALAKKGHMNMPFYALLELATVVLWCHVFFWTPVPYGELPAKWWLVMAVTTCFDVLYGVGISHAYSKLDMSLSYPLMRSLPIILTMLVTAVFGLGAPLGGMAVFGMVVVFLGCVVMPLPTFRHFALRNYWNKGMLYVLAAAAAITGYTVMDSVALGMMNDYPCCAGISKATIAVSYFVMRNSVLAGVLWVFTLAVPAHRKMLVAFIRTRNWLPLPAGLFASLAYALVMIGMGYVTNVAFVQVFRQLGLPIGVVLGVVFLKEKATATKWVGVSLILAGLACCAGLPAMLLQRFTC